MSCAYNISDSQCPNISQSFICNFARSYSYPGEASNPDLPHSESVKLRRASQTDLRWNAISQRPADETLSIQRISSFSCKRLDKLTNFSSLTRCRSYAIQSVRRIFASLMLHPQNSSSCIMCSSIDLRYIRSPLETNRSLSTNSLISSQIVNPVLFSNFILS